MHPVSETAIPLVPETAGLAESARALAVQWGLPFAEQSTAEYQLCLTPERLELRAFTPDAPGPVCVDFVGGALGHRRKFGGGRGQPIAKAVGLKGGAAPSVVDATAGLGRDGFVLAALGCRVTLVERSPVVAALLADGLRRASLDKETAPIVAQGLQLHHADGVDYLRGLSEAQRPDVVYLDPMFPHRPKSALVKKEMQVLQALLGAAQDELALLNAALQCAGRRVVVKRPAYAGPLAGRAPTLSFPGKKNRYDVYVIKAMAG